MPKSAYWENELLALLFNGTAVPNVADNAASAPLTSLYLSLHTAAPGTGGSQQTNEATYTGYARLAVARNGSGWTVSGGTVNPAATLIFNACTAGGDVITHLGIGTDPTGAGHLLYYGTVTPNITVAAGISPVLTSASSITEA